MITNAKNLSLRLVIILISSIFLGELFIMWLFANVIKVSSSLEAILDSAFLTIFCIPIIYYFVFKSFNREVQVQKEMQAQLLLASAAFQTHDGIMITDANSKIIRINKAFEKITGFSQDEVLGKTPKIFRSGRHNFSFYKDMWETLNSSGIWKGEVWNKSKNGNSLPLYATITAVKDENAEISQYVAVYTNISENKKAENEIYKLAFYDDLTGLPNRRLLLDRLNVAQSSSGRSQLYGAIIFIDLDNFKSVNDKFGHNHANNLLIDVANRLKFSIREADTVARLSGDEFVVMLENLSTDIDDAAQKVAYIAENLLSIIRTPYSLNETMIHSSASVGISLFLDHNLPSDEVIKHSEMAMYQAKEAGRNRVQFFDPQIQESIEIQNVIESDLHLALKYNQLELYYQIQLDKDRFPIGAEALVRWKHPQRGLVSPGEFIPVAEQSSLIIEIGNWVIETVCQQIAIWSKSELTKNLVIAINISPRQFMHPDFVEQLASIVHKYQIDASLLKLELTESVMADDLELIIKKMYILKQVVGVTLSLDDFGTGYSSLSYLKKLPLDQIKIDQSFVRHMTTDYSDAMMVKNIIDLAHNFGFNVIAEGVETEAQLALLKKSGCMSYQGYLFSKPIPSTQFELLLNDNLATYKR
jgi:diguanylate cyclase (GGDEF)-like protein/PAS domain S-box-containing protein